MQTPYLFISHSSRDKTFVSVLQRSLEYYGIPIFVDDKDIAPGDSIPERIHHGIERSTHLILILSAHAIASNWVREEFDIAKMRERINSSYKIIPLLIEDMELPVFLAHVKYLDFRQWMVKEKYYDELKRLVRALNIRIEYSSGSEITFLISVYPELIRAKETADVTAQLLFQLEQAFFNSFGQDIQATMRHGSISIKKSLDRFILEDLVGRLDELQQYDNTSERLTDLRTLCSSLSKSLLSFLLMKGTYEDIWKTEQLARSISATIFALFIEAEAMMRGQSHTQ